MQWATPVAWQCPKLAPLNVLQLCAIAQPSLSNWNWSSPVGLCCGAAKAEHPGKNWPLTAPLHFYCTSVNLHLFYNLLVKLSGERIVSNVSKSLASVVFKKQVRIRTGVAQLLKLRSGHIWSIWLCLSSLVCFEWADLSLVWKCSLQSFHFGLSQTNKQKNQVNLIWFYEFS